MRNNTRLLAASFAFATLFGAAAWAQQPPTPTVRIRGTIEAVDGAVLSIKSREGTDMKVRMTDNATVFAVVKTVGTVNPPAAVTGSAVRPMLAQMARRRMHEGRNGRFHVRGAASRVSLAPKVPLS